MFSFKTVSSKKGEAGFTMIELMIVVTIVGILASIAVPVYRGYAIKARVSESVSIFTMVKTEYSIYHNDTRNLPTSLSDLAGVSPRGSDFEGKYIRWLRVRANGNVRLRTKNMAQLGDAANKLLEFRPTIADGSMNINWDVFVGNNTSRWVPRKFLPNI